MLLMHNASVVLQNLNFILRTLKQVLRNMMFLQFLPIYLLFNNINTIASSMEWFLTLHKNKIIYHIKCQ